MSLRNVISIVISFALLPGVLAAQQVEYYHLDALGSVRAVTDESGGIITRHDYYPYGEEWNEPASNDTRRFTGKERDQESGFDYFGARYYGSGIGRFTAIDPVYTWSENLADPQRWNRYAYGRDNPLRYVDPDGRVVRLLGSAKDQQYLLGTTVRNLTPTEQKAVSLDKNGSVQIKPGSKGTTIAFKSLQELVQAKQIVQVQRSETMTSKLGPGPGRTKVVDLQRGGGGVTVDSRHSLSGNVEVHLDPRGNPQGEPSQIVLGHELFGHALDIIKTGTSSERSAVTMENALRQEQGLPLRPVPSK